MKDCFSNPMDMQKLLKNTLYEKGVDARYRE